MFTFAKHGGFHIFHGLQLGSYTTMFLFFALFQYQNVFAPLIKLEADYDKVIFFLFSSCMVLYLSCLTYCFCLYFLSSYTRNFLLNPLVPFSLMFLWYLICSMSM
jgi:hypothetical protein